MKAYKVTASGDYATEDYKRVDFSGLQGIIPAVDRDLAEQALRMRYAPMWLSQSEKYTQRMKKLRGCFMDSMEEIDYEFSYVGKDVKELSYEELQDLATALQLRRVPLYKKSSLQETRRIAYVEYSNKLRKTHLSEKSDEFDYASLPPLIVEEQIINTRVIPKTNTQVLDEIQKGMEYTIDDLRNMLTERGVKFDKRLGYDRLFELAFPQEEMVANPQEEMVANQ